MGDSDTHGTPIGQRGVPRARWLRLLPVLLLVFGLAAACGPLGDDDEDPTATAPAVPAGDESGAPIASPAATPAATPRVVAGVGTPRAGSAPTQTPEEEDEPDATTAPEDEQETPAVDAETPEADGEDAEPTEGPDPTTVVVAGCEEPDPLPDRTGRQNRIVAEEGLRLRSGPGTSCDEILSLSLETPVRVLSGVVEAEGDDNEWVKVDIDGTEGWVAVEFLENPPAE